METVNNFHSTAFFAAAAAAAAPATADVCLNVNLINGSRCKDENEGDERERMKRKEWI